MEGSRVHLPSPSTSQSRDRNPSGQSRGSGAKIGGGLSLSLSKMNDLHDSSGHDGGPKTARRHTPLEMENTQAVSGLQLSAGSDRVWPQAVESDRQVVSHASFSVSVLCNSLVQTDIQGRACCMLSTLEHMHVGFPVRKLPLARI